METSKNLKTPEQVKGEEEIRSKLRLLSVLASEIIKLGGSPEQYPLLDTLYDDRYTDEIWKSEMDRLTGLIKKMKMRELEIVRAWVFARLNGHYKRFTYKIKKRTGETKLIYFDAHSFIKVKNFSMVITDEYVKTTNQIAYEDEDGEKIVIASDSDLTEAINYARSAGLKVLTLHLDFYNSTPEPRSKSSLCLPYNPPRGPLKFYYYPLSL